MNGLLPQRRCRWLRRDRAAHGRRTTLDTALEGPFTNVGGPFANVGGPFANVGGPFANGPYNEGIMSRSVRMRAGCILPASIVTAIQPAGPNNPATTNTGV